MSIHKDKMQVYTTINNDFNSLAIKVSLPIDLTYGEHQHEWGEYIRLLPPANQLQRTGEALDAFLELSHRTSKDICNEPKAAQEELYSAWMAADIAMIFVNEKLGYQDEATVDYKKRNYIDKTDLGLKRVVEFLTSVGSPQVEIWGNRQERYAALMTENEEIFSELRREVAGGGMSEKLKDSRFKGQDLTGMK